MTSTYPQWVANIVPVPKKGGKVRMCMDYRDLDKVTSKDDFPLQHLDMEIKVKEKVQKQIDDGFLVTAEYP